jgi:hypothetical protein
MGLKAVATLVPGGGPPVGGSGTPGKLPIWTAASTLGDSAIVQVAGAIATVTLTAGGAGYTSATYSQQALTGGTGTGATADIVVAGGVVTSCVLRSPGTGYTAADALSCATIGAGAGFVATVATIAQTVNGSGNLTALGRIGAGTATPRAALDVVGGGAFIEGTEFTVLNLWSGVTVASSVSAAIGKGTEAALNLPFGSSRNFSLYAGQRINANAAGATTDTGIGAYPAFEIAGAAATTFLTGVAAFPVRSFAADVTSTASLTGVLGGCTIQSTAGCTNTVNASAFIAQLNLSKAGNTTAAAHHLDATLGNVGTVSTMTSVRLRPITGAGTIGTFYGMRIEATTAQTITNRWGISQEDALAKNYFAGDVGIGTAAPSGPLSVTPLQYSTGTASQALLVVTGVGTTFTAAMVGSQLVFASGVSAGTITAFINATTITVSISQTVTAQAYKISYTGLQVSTGGNVGIGTASPTAALHLPAGTTARASLNITSGAAPTAPNNGDIWFDGTNIFMRVGGVTKTFTLV